MIYTNENYIPPVTYCEPNKVEVQKNEVMEQIFIDGLRMAPKETQAILLETYIQEYGPISDENGEVVRKILMRRGEEDD